MNLNKGGEKMVEMNYRKLQGRIKEICGTQETFAKALGISNVSLTNKLTNRSPWKQEEILKACDILRLEVFEISTYFFARAVKKS